MNNNYFKYSHSQLIHNINAPTVILPLVFDFVEVKSVLDIGCGIGTWLSVAKSLGVSDIKGVDGEYVDQDLLSCYLEKDEFVSHDLTNFLDLGRKFDICFCLEVAEHLPPFAAKVLVKTLVSHSDVILFSAAIPGQGGQYHLNEQWHIFWSKLFNDSDYIFVDLIRPLIWDENKIEFWYRQNIFFVVKKNHRLAKFGSYNFIQLVHPELFINILNNNKYLLHKIENLSKEINEINKGKKSLFYYLKKLLNKLLNKLLF